MSRIVPLLLLIATVGGCKAGPMKIAGQTIRHVQQARDLTGKQLASAMRATHAQCLAKHGAKTQAFADCVRPVLDAQSKWAKIARPVIDAAAAAASAALKTAAVADACKKAKDCHKRVIAFLRPGFCAISRGVRNFGHFFGDKGAAVLATLAVFEGVACE